MVTADRPLAAPGCSRLAQTHLWKTSSQRAVGTHQSLPHSVCQGIAGNTEKGWVAGQGQLGRTSWVGACHLRGPKGSPQTLQSIKGSGSLPPEGETRRANTASGGGEGAHGGFHGAQRPAERLAGSWEAGVTVEAGRWARPKQRGLVSVTGTSVFDMHPHPPSCPSWPAHDHRATAWLSPTCIPDPPQAARNLFPCPISWPPSRSSDLEQAGPGDRAWGQPTATY